MMKQICYFLNVFSELLMGYGERAEAMERACAMLATTFAIIDLTRPARLLLHSIETFPPYLKVCHQLATL